MQASYTYMLKQCSGARRHAKFSKKGLRELQDAQFEEVVYGNGMNLDYICVDGANVEENGSNYVGDQSVLEDGIRTEDDAEIIELRIPGTCK